MSRRVARESAREKEARESLEVAVAAVALVPIQCGMAIKIADMFFRSSDTPAWNTTLKL